MVKSNRLNYHTKRNGVGLQQGFCECVEGSTMPPCSEIRDLLDISPDEFEKMTSGRLWG